MRKSKFSEVQIAAILKEAEAGVPVTEVARKNGISAALFYQWRSKYGGMEPVSYTHLDVYKRQVLAEPAWRERMTVNDWRGLTPLIYHHVNPYGRIELDMARRLALAA